MANSKGNKAVILSIVGVAVVLTVVLVLITRKSKKIEQLKPPPAAAPPLAGGTGEYTPPYTPPYVAVNINGELGIGQSGGTDRDRAREDTEEHTTRV